MKGTNQQKRSNHSQQLATGFAWPMFLPNGCHISRKSDYGFEIVLPGFSTLKEGREFYQENQNSSKIPEQQKPEELIDENEERNGSAVDYNELDRLFSKMNSFSGKLTTKYNTYGVFDENSSLVKRPPRVAGRTKNSKEQYLPEDSTPTRSSYSKRQDDFSESIEKSVSRPRPVRVNQVSTRRTRRSQLRQGTDRQTQPASSANQIRENGRKTRSRRSPVRINFKPSNQNSMIVNGEWVLIEFLRELILRDEFRSDLMKLFNDVELDVSYRILRMRYKGAEYFRFPARIKNINPENNKCNSKFLNEKKLLGEVWPWIIDELKNTKQLWQENKDEAVAEIFKIYHKPYYMDEIKKEINDTALISQINKGDDVLLVNLFAEIYLGYPQ